MKVKHAFEVHKCCSGHSWLVFDETDKLSCFCGDDTLSKKYVSLDWPVDRGVAQKIMQAIQHCLLEEAYIGHVTGYRVVIEGTEFGRRYIIQEDINKLYDEITAIL